VRGAAKTYPIGGLQADLKDRELMCYRGGMSIEELTKAVAELPPDKFAKFRDWFEALRLRCSMPRSLGRGERHAGQAGGQVRRRLPRGTCPRAVSHDVFASYSACEPIQCQRISPSISVASAR